MKIKKLIKLTLIIILTVLIVFLGLSLCLVVSNINEVKHLNVSIGDNNISACQIYDKDSNLTLNSQNIKNNYVKLSDIKQETIDAFLSIEDKTFYKHDGLNYPRILKAILTNIKNKEYSQGASTISQQLIKNKYLTNEKSLSRKIKEIYLTKKLEAQETKDKILENYLNTIYYGNGAYGIGNAAYRFFGKTTKELNLSESCVLAGAVNYPYLYSPINNMNESTLRRNLVLKEMYKDGKIDEETYLKTIKENINLCVKNISNNNLDLYTRNVLKEASEILNVSVNEIINRNYKIYTYQDNNIQEALNNHISNEKYYSKNEYGNIPDSLSIIIDNQNGGVSAISGKSNYDLLDFKRQPGSLVKPILVYTPALEEKIIYSCSEILDDETKFNEYKPQNVGNKYYGYTSIYDCVSKSLNVPAVKLCEKLGVIKCKEYGKKCGLKFGETDNGLAIALGGLENGFTLQNITESYLPFSNDGIFKKSTYIQKIVSPNNLTIYNNKMTEERYCSAENAYIMTDILKYSCKEGTSKKLSKCNYQIAGKTGTVNVKNSNKNTDAYSLAYTKDHTMSVWFGNYTMDDKYHLSSNNNGGTFATELIKDTLNFIYRDNYPKDFEKPDSVVEESIDLISLEDDHCVLLADNSHNRYQKTALFSKNNLPPKSEIDLDKVERVDFKLINNLHSIEIRFDCKKYYKYDLYRLDCKGNNVLINSISNFNGEYKYLDNNICYNSEYKYYVICSSLMTNNKTQSDIKTIQTTKDYSNLLNPSNEFLWSF